MNRRVLTKRELAMFTKTIQIAANTAAKTVMEQGNGRWGSGDMRGSSYILNIAVGGQQNVGTVVHNNGGRRKAGKKAANTVAETVMEQGNGRWGSGDMRGSSYILNIAVGGQQNVGTVVHNNGGRRNAGKKAATLTDQRTGTKTMMITDTPKPHRSHKSYGNGKGTVSTYKKNTNSEGKTVTKRVTKTVTATYEEKTHKKKSSTERRGYTRRNKQ